MKSKSVILRVIFALMLAVGAFLATETVANQATAQASGEASLGAIPQEILYPKFLHERDVISYENVKRELKFRSRFLAHMYTGRSVEECYKNQKRLYKALENMKKAMEEEGETFVLPEISNATVFSKESPIAFYAKLAVTLPSQACSFAAHKDGVDPIGIIYCRAHGVEGDLLNSFAKRNLASFKRARPWFNAFDMAELVLFLPAPIIFVISAFIMKKMIKG